MASYPPLIDLTGQRFGMLTVLQRAPRAASNYSTRWLCRCDCGETKSVRASHLRSPKGTLSCGCSTERLKREALLLDRVGRRYGMLTVIREGRCYRNSCGKLKTYWVCRCDCGREKEVMSVCLHNGSSKSCGCATKRMFLTKQTIHGGFLGGKPTPEYRTWSCMKCRCYNPNDPGYPRYGAKGIAVCDRWRNSFANFLADMGPKPEGGGWSLDRKDGTKGYSPDNCRWATATQQSRNRGEANRWVTYGGETLTLAEWAERLDMNGSTLAKRLKRWPIERAMTTPLQ
jgi:hypothetical protein